MIAVTGASGKLGSLAIAGLLKEVASNQLLALVRGHEKAGTAAAARADYAAAAVAVLTTDGHDGKTYEFAGDHAFTLRELAEAVSNSAGWPLPYNDLPACEYRQVLAQAGIADRIIELLVGTDLAIARGDLDSNSRDLRRLSGAIPARFTMCCRRCRRGEQNRPCVREKQPSKERHHG